MRLCALLLVAFVAEIGFATEAKAEELLIYSGRNQALVGPVIKQFEKETGIKVTVRYGGSAQLATALMEEGERSKADLFWSQDASTLGAVTEAGLLAPLDAKLADEVPSLFRNDSRYWVATSGRARVLAYSSERVTADVLPASVFDLTAPQFKGKVGWAPTNGSFQTFVTAMRKVYGDEKTLAWLRGVKANGAKAYRNNTAIAQAIADGEIDLGITNHYYLFRFKAADPNFPVEQTHFKDGDIGNMMMVAGIGRLKNAPNSEAANRFIAFVLSGKAQTYFTAAVFEYPMISTVIANETLSDLESVVKRSPKLDLGDLSDLEGTTSLLRQAGLQ